VPSRAAADGEYVVTGIAEMGYVNSSDAVAPGASRGMLSLRNAALLAGNALPPRLPLPIVASGKKLLAYLLL
jgi:hypothetical protein